VRAYFVDSGVADVVIAAGADFCVAVSGVVAGLIDLANLIVSSEVTDSVSESAVLIIDDVLSDKVV